MTDRDPVTDLRQLARAGEEAARPMPAERARQLGDRRRTRRQVGRGVAAVALVVVAGGAVLSQGGLGLDRTPQAGETPSVASPVPERTVTEANLITAAQVPVVGRERFEEAPPRRAADQVTVCVPDQGPDQLGGTGVVSRSFRLARRADGLANKPRGTLAPEPTVYTQAWQFSSPATAFRAYQTYRSWLEDCATTLDARGDVPLGAGADWVEVDLDVAGATGGFAEQTWREGHDTSQNGYFESVGLALVEDRLAVTVSLQYGQDYSGVSYRPGGDPDLELPPHPQFDLLSAAAQRLR